MIACKASSLIRLDSLAEAAVPASNTRKENAFVRMSRTVSAPATRFQANPCRERACGGARALLELADERRESRNFLRTRRETAIERAAPERPDGVHQAAVFGGEERAGTVGAKRRPLA